MSYAYIQKKASPTIRNEDWLKQVETNIFNKLDKIMSHELALSIEANSTNDLLGAFKDSSGL
jgi:hypothetical protein